jgi:hypothetical protein
MVTYALAGNEVVFRVQITPDERLFNRGKDEGRGLPLQLLAQSTNPELLGAAKVAQQELEQVQGVIRSLEGELAGMKPGEGIEGLVRHKRAQAEKREEIEAAKEVMAALQRQANNALGELAGSIGGKATQVTLPCPNDVQAVLSQLETITTTNAPLLVKHAGVMAGFHAGRMGLDSLSVAHTLVSLPMVAQAEQ